MKMNFCLCSNPHVFQVVVFQKVLTCEIVPAEGIQLVGQRLVMVARFMGKTLVTGIDGQGDDAGAFMDPRLVVGFGTPSLYAQKGSPAVKAKLVSRPHDR